MSSETLPLTRLTLARRLGLDAFELDGLLAGLERVGFIDRERVRLTWTGLAAAARLRAARPRRAQVTRVAA